jgi:uroporphyrinogen-III synthase
MDRSEEPSSDSVACTALTCKLFYSPTTKQLILPPILIHNKIEFHSQGDEDFALYLPPALVPSKRVLLLRYRNRFESLAQSLQMKGMTVTSAYPVTWMRKEWSPQEERSARDVDGL